MLVLNKKKLGKSATFSLTISFFDDYFWSEKVEGNWFAYCGGGGGGGGR